MAYRRLIFTALLYLAPFAGCDAPSANGAAWQVRQAAQDSVSLIESSDYDNCIASTTVQRIDGKPCTNLITQAPMTFDDLPVDMRPTLETIFPRIQTKEVLGTGLREYIYSENGFIYSVLINAASGTLSLNTYPYTFLQSGRCFAVLELYILKAHSDNPLKPLYQHLKSQLPEQCNMPTLTEWPVACVPETVAR